MLSTNQVRGFTRMVSRRRVAALALTSAVVSCSSPLETGPSLHATLGSHGASCTIENKNPGYCLSWSVISSFDLKGVLLRVGDMRIDGEIVVGVKTKNTPVNLKPNWPLEFPIAFQTPRPERGRKVSVRIVARTERGEYSVAGECTIDSAPLDNAGSCDGL
jgi:hypothetical protein